MQRPLRHLWCALALAALAALAAPLAAAPGAALAGDYLGTLGPLHLRLHLAVGADGTLSGTLDIPEQGARGLACSDFKLEHDAFSFAVPSVHGTWQGTVGDAGRTLNGTWHQGAEVALNFSRDTFVAARTPSPVDGVWLGTLEAPRQGTLRIQIALKSDRDGREYCVLDSPDQLAWHIDCGEVSWARPDLAFEVPAVGGAWRGTLSGDASALSGTWSQGGRDLPLKLMRQVRPLEPPPAPKMTTEPALAPAEAAALPALVRKDFAAALKDGPLAPATSAGVAIGVVRQGVRRVFALGTARPDSIFEIGSISKTFTGLVLAQMLEQRKVQLKEPVRALLPPGTVPKPDGEEITLLDLITHHSGLPRLPDNFNPADPNDPYADYRAAELYGFLRQRGVAKPADAGFLYSNLGVGLLGQALANRAGMSYAQLVAEEVTGPLHLADTTVVLSGEQRARLIQGYSADARPTHTWELDALAGAGALHSTAADMLGYLEANLHPPRAAAGASGAARTLGTAIEVSHELRADAGSERIAFAWLFDTQRGEYWHNGSTGGYTSFAFFNPKGDYAGVVLLNTTKTAGPDGALADLLGRYLSRRFAGEPAVTFGAPQSTTARP
ncbi:MAG TPA: serine hydrolase domain-containing protein [Steroidobacteraceae bacterium]|nr:serine hydrolase domain-containing protein [Steroidobacteraceae bacterium]